MNAELHTFVFADLAGFTALTEAHGDERAADIAMEFCAELNRLLPEDAEDLKMLGDACLLRVGDAHAAVRLGVGVTEALAPRHSFPDVRVGMHTGTAVRRGADWFGATVNTAARVAELAGPGDVLLTDATRVAVQGSPSVTLEDRGSHELRHISAPVHLYRARSPATSGDAGRWVVDPVCRMRVDITKASATVGTHFFCSTSCAERFSQSPERYAGDRGAVRA